jgi:ABC-type nickel/cobalt efflux system permease component RcnA
VQKLKSSLWLALFVLIACPLGAVAHPMGNFSINHHSRITVASREIRLDYILDFAEIPTLQIAPKDKHVSEWIQKLKLTANGKALPLELTTSNFQVQSGAAGLSTLRATLHLITPWSGDSSSIRFSDGNFKERIGWKEIVVQAEPPMGFPKGNPFANDRSAGLSNYPADPASSAPDATELSIDVAADAVPALSTSSGVVPAVGTSAASPDRLSAILGRSDLPASLILFGMMIAFSLGALHALSPGHGKTVVASFLVGARGTARHALFLGAVVTFTHTIGVFLLGLAVLFLSDYVVPERLYPWIGFLSGAMILGVGVNLFRQRFSAFAHEQHEHGPGGHTHEIPDQITLRNLFALGFSGGIVPCPSALVVLLSAIAVHRVGAGLLFIVAFSLGLASVLVAIGILVVRASHVLARFDRDNSVLRFVPVVSAAVISVIGLAMALQALAGVDLGSSAVVVNSQMMAVLGLGLLLGLKHATDADHVVAVTTFVSQEPSLLRSCWIGVFWGFGHTLSLSIAGLIVIGLKVTISEWIAERLELGVAVMLVVLGVNALLRTPKPASSPGHFHLAGPGPSHSHLSHIGLRPLLTGMVHGAAGSAALMLLVLSTIRSPLEAFLYILIFGAGSILGMLAISFLLALPMHWARGRVSIGYKPIQVVAGLFSCVFGLYLGAEILMSLH